MLQSRVLACVLICGLVVSCSDSRLINEHDVEWREDVEREVTKRTWEFHAADTSRDANAVINLLWPEFTLLADGMRAGYAEVVEGSRAFMADVDSFKTEWTELAVIPLSSTSAISSFLFRDRIVMKSGEISESWGPNTFVWQKRGDEWRVIHTDADHYPLRDERANKTSEQINGDPPIAASESDHPR